MTIQPTLQLGNPLLRVRAAPVQQDELPAIRDTVTDLADTLTDWVSRTGYGRGIAAPQIGVSKRSIYLAVDQPWPLVNPRIIERSPQTWEPWDACLSFSLSFFCRVRRHMWITVEYETLDGGQMIVRSDGEVSELLQHEIDHLDGFLAVDRMITIESLCMRSEFELRHRHESPYRK